MDKTETVRFLISKVAIIGFRGIDRLELSLPKCQPSYIVGANNVGKTTFLEAIALALKQGGHHSFSPDAYDFHTMPDGSSADEFSIRLTFEPDGGKLPAVQGVGSPEFVHGVHVKGRRTRRGTEHSHYLTRADGSTISFSQTTSVKGNAKVEFAGTGVGYRPINARLDDIRDFLPEVWMLRPKEIAPSLYSWKTGPLKRLARLLSDKFLQSEWRFEWREKEREMPRGIENAHEFLTTAVRSFPFWRDDLKPKLEAALAEHLGGPLTFQIAPDIGEIENWLVQQLSIAFAVDTGSAPTPLPRMGDGLQSLVRLAALDVISQYSDDLMRNDRVLLLFEEPETHLHPHLRRKLRGTLQNLANRGCQVVTTTHASEFVSFIENQRLVRLDRKAGATRRFSPEAQDIRDEIRLQERLERGRATLEIPFAKRVLISEGKSDELAFRLALRSMGFDPDGASVSIVRGEGAPGLPPLARLARSLGLPWLAVTDDDLLDDGSANPKTEKARKELEELKTGADQTIVLKGRLEGALGLSRHADSHEIYSLLHSLSKVEIADRYPAFWNLCCKVQRWAQA